MKLYLTEQPGDRELAMDRGDVLEAITNGWQYATISGYPDRVKVVTVAGHFVTVKHPLHDMLRVATPRVMDMHRDEVAA